jgi:hypothetical protein
VVKRHLSDSQFEEWKSSYRPGTDIRVPQKRFGGHVSQYMDVDTDEWDRDDVVEGATEHARNWSEFREVPISQLSAQHHIDRANARMVFNSIKERGYDPDEHILVVGDESSGYNVINGHHRAIAARAAGMKEIPATLVSWDDVYRRIQGK